MYLIVYCDIITLEVKDLEKGIKLLSQCNLSIIPFPPSILLVYVVVGKNCSVIISKTVIITQEILDRKRSKLIATSQIYL